MNTGDFETTTQATPYALSEFTTKEVISVAPNALIEHAMDVMLQHEISGLPVIDEGRLVGVVSEFDILALLLESSDEPELIIPVEQIMSADVVSVSEEAPVQSVACIFRHLGMRRLPVVRDGQVVGIVSRRDLIRVVREQRREHDFELPADDDWQAWLYTADSTQGIVG